VAVQNGQQGTFVYVVDEDSRVHLTSVQVGITTDTSADILGGIADGDQVVIDGTDRLLKAPWSGSGKPESWTTRQATCPAEAAETDGAAAAAGRIQEGPERRRRPVSPSASSSQAGGNIADDGWSGARRGHSLPATAGLGATQVDYPTIQVQTFYPGSSPEVVTSSITAPLEKQFARCPG